MGTAGATSGRRWRRLRQATAIGLSVSLSGLSSLPVMNHPAAAAGETRTLSMYFAHTKESLTVTYKKDGRFVPEGLAKINHFLRDWRADEQTRMDPELIDLLWELHQELGSKQPIHIISGYRSSKTNAMLKSIGRNVARRSQHIQGKATDVYFPDVPLKTLRESALLREAGGVGYYPRSGQYGFVHIDTGRVRHWPRMSEQQLAALFRNKKNRTSPKQESPLMIARAERAGVPVPRTNPERATMPDATSQVASADTPRNDVPVPRSKPFYLAQNVVAIPVSAPTRRTDEPSLIEPDSTGSMALARVDSLVLPPPIPEPLGPGSPTVSRAVDPMLDLPAQAPRLMPGLDEPARPTLSVKSLRKPVPTVVASVAPAASVLPVARPAGQGERSDRRSLFQLPMLRRDAGQKLASLSPQAMQGDPSELTASIGNTATSDGLLAIRRTGKGDRLASASSARLAVIELSGNRRMVINRTNKGDFLGNRRAQATQAAPRLAAAILDQTSAAGELAGGDDSVADNAMDGPAAEPARTAVPKPRLRPEREAGTGSMVLSSIRQLFR